jgi:serine/threonine-protein kinase HipA
MKRCLYCYELLSESEIDFHSSCSKKFFGTPLPPVMQYAEKDLDSLAKDVIQSRTALTGVQSKLSLHISAGGSDATQKRFTIVGLWGGYILKPPSPHFPELPEVEDLTMHLAKAAKIKTAPHSLIRLSSGNLAYITKRIDRIKKSKLAMEDMCQLTERLTEHKYQGSHEQIAKTLLKYSATPGLDVINFFELVLFSFLTGNADMHLKNFSLLEQPGLGMVMSPAYDLVNTALVNPDDEEELALTLNGRKNKIKRQDFTVAMSALKIDEKQQENIFNKMIHAMPTWIQLIEKSFLSTDYKHRYAEILLERVERVK